jgi:hypothetical protein
MRRQLDEVSLTTPSGPGTPVATHAGHLLGDLDHAIA